MKLRFDNRYTMSNIPRPDFIRLDKPSVYFLPPALTTATMIIWLVRSKYSVIRWSGCNINTINEQRWKNFARAVRWKISPRYTSLRFAEVRLLSACLPARVSLLLRANKPVLFPALYQDERSVYLVRPPHGPYLTCTICMKPRDKLG